MKSYVIAGCALASLILVTPALAKSDKQFIRDAMKGDNSEIKLGELAQKMGSSEQVRNFGTMLASDHSNAKKEVGLLATKIDVKATDAMTDEAKQEMSKLKGLSGSAFDKEFTRYMVDDHEKDVAEFKEKANEGKGEVSTLAAQTVPVLTKHLETAQRLSAQ